MADQLKAIIFDMGGVLLKTVDPSPREALAKRFGATREELESFTFSSESSHLSEKGVITDKEHWEVVLKRFGQPTDTYLPIYDEFFSGDGIDQDLLEFAVSLKGDYLLGLLSNAWVNARPLLGERFDFIDRFDISLFSYEVGLRKPDPVIYEVMVKKLGVEPGEAVFIDDFPANVEGAQLAGLRAIQYRNTPQIIADITRLTAC